MKKSNLKIWLASGIVGVSLSAALVTNGIKLSDLYEFIQGKVHDQRYVSGSYEVKIMDGNIHAFFRGDEFKFVPHKVTESGLHEVLYNLNSNYNPNLRIKGDRLERLADLFQLTRNNSVLYDAEAQLGEGKHQFNVKYPINVGLRKNDIYLFPVYSHKNQ